MNETTNDIYTVEETPHDDMRLIFLGDIYIGWYNPQLARVL